MSFFIKMQNLFYFSFRKAGYVLKNNYWALSLFLVVAIIVTSGFGYTEKNAPGNILLLFILLYLAHKNTLSTIVALLFLFCAVFYIPVGLTFGKINNGFILALLQTDFNESREFIEMLPLYHYLFSICVLVFMYIFWKSHQSGHHRPVILVLFLICSVNSWPVRMIKKTYADTVSTVQEIKRYAQLRQHNEDTWKITATESRYDTVVIVIGESVRRDYMSVYGYPLQTTPWLNNAAGIFIDGYTSVAASTVLSLSRTLIPDYDQNPQSGNSVVALAGKAGRGTWWLSNQGQLGMHDSLISVIASAADHSVFLKRGSFSSRNTDDELLVAEMQRALSQPSSQPRVIFIHMMGSHPNPCDRLQGYPNHYSGQFNEKTSCYISTISKLDAFLQKLDRLLRQHSSRFAMLYFSDHGLSVSNAGNPVHHDGSVQEGYAVPLIITSSDITSHKLLNRKISARHLRVFSSG